MGDTGDMGDAELIDALCDVEDGLYSGELKFVDEEGRKLAAHRKAGGEDRDWSLSSKQRSWANRIWERVGA